MAATYGAARACDIACRTTRLARCEAERIPHDLWPAGNLPELSLAEQLTVLLIGFDLTFELRPEDRRLRLCRWQALSVARMAEAEPTGKEPPCRSTAPCEAAKTKQVYTLARHGAAGGLCCASWRNG